MSKALRLLLVACLLTAGCTLPRGCAHTDVLCAGLVTTTAGLEDHGLAESAWRALQRAQSEELLRQADAIESQEAADYGKNLAALAEEGYDLVIAAGAVMQEQTLEAARRYPAVQFVGLGQEMPEEEAPPNYRAVSFAYDQGGFLAGALAARMTQTGIVGAVCESSGLKFIEQLCLGFQAGVRYVDRDLKVFVEYHEPEASEDIFVDEEWGARAARGMLRAGADVIFAAGGRTGQAALEAAAAQGDWAIGWEQDQYYLLPASRPQLLSSVVPDAEPAVYAMALALSQGEPLPETPGSLRLAPYHEADRFLTDSIRAELEELQRQLEAGGVRTNVR